MRRREVPHSRWMTLPPELYRHIFFHLSIPDLFRAAQVSRLFYQITQGCLVNEKYITRWNLAFNEDGYSRRIIPLDLEATRQELNSETGLYVFTSKIRPISCTNEYAEALHNSLNVSTRSFGLRFLDFNDIGSSYQGTRKLIYLDINHGISIPTESMSPSLRCGEFISFTISSSSKNGQSYCRMSPTSPDRIMWKIELLRNRQDTMCATSDERSLEIPKTCDKIRVFVSIEAIRYEYTVRKQVRRAGERSSNKLCVCRELISPTEH